MLEYILEYIILEYFRIVYIEYSILYKYFIIF